MKTYEEHIVEACEEAIADITKTATDTIYWLKNELLTCIHTNSRYEQTLKAMLPKEVFHNLVHNLAAEIAKECFKKEIEGAPDSEFKDFALENYDDIVKDGE